MYSVNSEQAQSVSINATVPRRVLCVRVVLYLIGYLVCAGLQICQLIAHV